MEEVKREPALKAVNDDCEVCNGPCKWGNCPECKGHSQHNYGCSKVHTDNRSFYPS